MIWTTLGFVAIGFWAMLHLFSSEHRRQVQEHEQREQLNPDSGKPPTSVS